MPNASNSNGKKRKRASSKSAPNVNSNKKNKASSNIANKDDVCTASKSPDENAITAQPSDFASKQTSNNKAKLGDITLSSFKLAQIKKHRKNSAKSEKSQLQSNLISLGYNPRNMSLMKQRKLLDKAMKKLSKKEGENDDTAESTVQKEADPLAFMQDNDLFADDGNKESNHNQQKRKAATTNSKAKNNNKTAKKLKSGRKTSETAMDLEFGDVVKPDIDLKQQIEEERFIRTGKANKPMSDRKLLRVLKKRDKFIQRRFGEKRVFVDDVLASNAMRKIRGQKVKNDLNALKAKLKRKHKSKLKSQKKWRERIKRREHGKNKKLDRRDANVAAYRQRKVNKRMKNRITTEHALAVANEMM